MIYLLFLTLDHFITADELKNVMKRLGQTLSDDEINLMITEADTDGDKQVNYKGMLYHKDFSHKILNSISLFFDSLRICSINEET
jgi:Ca2+-binding EF-hand superfamily protein